MPNLECSQQRKELADKLEKLLPPDIIETINLLDQEIDSFFSEISPDEFKDYITHLTADAIMGDEDDDDKFKVKASNRVTVLMNLTHLIYCLYRAKIARDKYKLYTSSKLKIEI